MKRFIFVLAAALLASVPCVVLAITQGAGLATKDILPAGSISRSDGLQAWTRIQAVVTSPRCANCHVDAAAVPIWSPAGETASRVHGMYIHGGASRMGTEKLPCSTCHVTSRLPNDPAPAPPHAGIDWQLAPVAFIWYGMSGAEICAQMKDPLRNGGRDGVGLLEHLRHDASLSGFIPRAWAPGAGRTPPPGTFEEHVKDMAQWVAAGEPCPD